MPKVDPPVRPAELLDALARNDDVYYFGVGSNLSRAVMEKRGCAPVSMKPGLVRNCRLAFNLKGMPPSEPAFGGLEPLPGYYENDHLDSTEEVSGSAISKRNEGRPVLAYDKDEIHGALIRLSARDYSLVYESEGGGTADLYEEIMVDCVPYDPSQPIVKAVAFRARDHARTAHDACPSKRYMSIICAGAAELGLCDSYQRWLKDHPVQSPSRIVRHVARYSMVFAFSLSLGPLKISFVENIVKALLFRVYVLPTEPLWKQIAGEVASIVIMTPSACLGFTLRHFLESTCLMPPVLKNWLRTPIE
jgi:hypothetical protein